MRINIEASAEELAEIGVGITEIPNLIIIAMDSCISLPGYTVTVNEPSAIQAQLVAALKDAKTRLMFADHHIDCSEEIDKADLALAAAGAQP